MDAVSAEFWQLSTTLGGGHNADQLQKLRQLTVIPSKWKPGLPLICCSNSTLQAGLSYKPHTVACTVSCGMCSHQPNFLSVRHQSTVLRIRTQHWTQHYGWLRQNACAVDPWPSVSCLVDGMLPALCCSDQNQNGCTPAKHNMTQVWYLGSSHQQLWRLQWHPVQRGCGLSYITLRIQPILHWLVRDMNDELERIQKKQDVS